MEKVERPAGADTWTRTYWVDPQTRLPVRIEIQFSSTHPMQGEGEWVQSRFRLRCRARPGAFQHQPPEGYKDLAAETANPKVPKSSERVLIYYQQHRRLNEETPGSFEWNTPVLGKPVELGSTGLVVARGAGLAANSTGIP